MTFSTMFLMALGLSAGLGALTGEPLVRAARRFWRRARRPRRDKGWDRYFQN